MKAQGRNHLELVVLEQELKKFMDSVYHYFLKLIFDPPIFQKFR